MAFPNGKQSYAELTDGEKWTWHTGIYAYRQVRLEQPIAPGSPTDPEGKWFNRQAIELEVHRFRNKGKSSAPLLDTKAREGRAILYGYARQHGFASWDEAEAAGATYTDAI